MEENKIYIFTEYSMYFPTSEKTHICVASNIDNAIQIIFKKLIFHSQVESSFNLIKNRIQEFGLDMGYINYEPIYE